MPIFSNYENAQHNIVVFSRNVWNTVYKNIIPTIIKTLSYKIRLKDIIIYFYFTASISNQIISLKIIFSY